MIPEHRSRKSCVLQIHKVQKLRGPGHFRAHPVADHGHPVVILQVGALVVRIVYQEYPVQVRETNDRVRVIVTVAADGEAIQQQVLPIRIEVCPETHLVEPPRFRDALRALRMAVELGINRIGPHPHRVIRLDGQDCPIDVVPEYLAKAIAAVQCPALVDHPLIPAVAVVVVRHQQQRRREGHVHVAVSR